MQNSSHPPEGHHHDSSSSQSQENSGSANGDSHGRSDGNRKKTSFKDRMRQRRRERSATGDNFNLKGALSVKLPKHASTDALQALEKCSKGCESSSDNQLEDHVILLPHHHDPVTHFALDIGGSLIKMVYYEAGDRLEHNKTRSATLARKKGVVPSSPIVVSAPSSTVFTEDEEHSNEQRVDLYGGRICFARFRTADIINCMSFIETLQPHSKIVHTTGGGAFKFASLLKDRLGISIKKVDEMESLISGLNFLLRNIEDEAFIYENHVKIPKSFKDNGEQLYPYLLVNIGSGVSVLKVTGDKSYERVSGSSLGGGTFWGLCNMLTGVESFEDMLEMTKRGDNRNVDMLVGDIYGRDYGKVGLAAETIASSCAKPVMIMNRRMQENNIDAGSAAMGIPEEAEPNFCKEDVAKSLLYAICNNIGQIAYLNAMRFNLKRIFFAGYFIRDHAITMSSISYGIRYWSNGEMSALFLKHEGYLGAIGSFFKCFTSRTQDNEADQSDTSPTSAEAS